MGKGRKEGMNANESGRKLYENYEHNSLSDPTTNTDNCRYYQCHRGRGIHVQVFESRSNQPLDTFGVSSNLQRYLFVGFGLPNAALVCLNV